MGRSQGEIRITLKSDLCVGSGYSYAGIVDSDACYDACGLPYIPAKRLKGCLREAAEMIGVSSEQTDRIFGKAGQNQVNGVFLENAYIENHEQLHRELSGMDKKLREYMTAQNVLEQFTKIKAQTKIMENGVAQDNSLRYTRTVNHYSPVREGEELQFVAAVSFAGLEEGDIRTFGKIVKALRNIGMNRNRGLGSVRCEMILADRAGADGEDAGLRLEDDKEYCLSYAVRNTAPLMLSANNDSETEKYISGQSVLGYFAGAYLRAGGDGDSAEFEDMFLKNQVIFSALYPCDEDNGGRRRVYYPAPSYINQLKKTKKYVNVSKVVPQKEEDCAKKGIEKDFASGNGNQPKRLNGQFVCVEGNHVAVREVETELVYHHKKKSMKHNAQNEELLYAFEVVREQQTFAGTISGQGKYLKKLEGFLTSGKMRFGKSKSSQYGVCVLNGSIEEQAQPVVRARKGDKILVSFQSDAVFTNEIGYTTRCAEIRAQIKDALGIVEAADACGEDELYQEITTKELTGYYSKWNLKRQAVPAVGAGSTFEFLLAEDLPLSSKDLYVGERKGEGYGKVTVVENAGEDCRMQSEKAEQGKMIAPEVSKEICRKILLAELHERLMQNAQHIRLSLDGASALGRVTQMLTDSCGRYPDDPNGRFADFCKRVESIKADTLRRSTKKMIDTLIRAGEIKKEEDRNEKEQSFRSLDELEKPSELKYLGLAELEKVKTIYTEYYGWEDFLSEMKKLWSDYLMMILTRRKYELKRKEDR